MTAKNRTSGRGWAVFGCSAVISAALLAVSLSYPVHGSSPAPVRGPAADVKAPELADLIETVQPSVVTITVTKSGGASHPAAYAGDPRAQEFFERFFGRGMPAPSSQQPQRGVGSGFIIEADGYVVTNNHVIDGADEITVTLHNGTEHPAELLGTDAKTDLALLKIDADDLSEARFGDSDQARVGDWIVAIGNPFGFGGSATVGIISARGRDLRAGPYDDFLQIDAPINQGNSGGPVFNTHGDVIGVNTAIYSPNGGNVGIGFAIPASQARHIVGELKDSGAVDRGWLGVQLQEMDNDLAESLGFDAPTGALVAQVEDGSPAAAADLRAGDVITGFAGATVESPKTLSRMVGNTNSSTRVEIEIRRNGRDKTLNATLGMADEPLQVAASGDNTELGLALAPLDDSARTQLGVEDHVRGAVISNVKPSSTAAERGLRRGDIIVGVDQREVTSPSDVASAISRARKDGEDSVLLLVRRNGAQRFASLPLA